MRNRTQEICDKTLNTYPSAIKLFVNAIRIKKCVINLLIDVSFCI